MPVRILLSETNDVGEEQFFCSVAGEAVTIGALYQNPGTEETEMRTVILTIEEFGKIVHFGYTNINVKDMFGE